MDEVLRNAPSAPRLCHVAKVEAKQEYGYNLHAERNKGQFIGNVDLNSPADIAGLKSGDRIIAVNGSLIANETHKQVVERIKQNAMYCDLLVIDELGAQWYRDNDIELTTTLPNIVHMGQNKAHSNSNASKENGSHRMMMSGEARQDEEHDDLSSTKSSELHENSSQSPPPATWYQPPPPPQTNKAANFTIGHTQSSAPDQMNHPRPRLCRLAKSIPSDEFGFNLHAEKGRGHFIGTVDHDGIGDKAGLITGQRIVGVNGELVYPNTPHKDVVALIKLNPMTTTLLVASEEIDKYYRDHSLNYSFDMVDVFNSSASPPPYHEEHITPAPMMHTQADDDSSSTSSDSSHKSEEHHHIAPTPSVGDRSIIQHEPSSTADQHSRTSSQSSTGVVPTIAHHNFTDTPLPVASSVSPNVPPTQHLSMMPTISEHSHSHAHSHAPVQISPIGDQRLDNLFNLSASEARARLSSKKADPRANTSLTLQEKHRLISNM